MHGNSFFPPFFLFHMLLAASSLATCTGGESVQRRQGYGRARKRTSCSRNDTLALVRHRLTRSCLPRMAGLERIEVTNTSMEGAMAAFIARAMRMMWGLERESGRVKRAGGCLSVQN
jgi:hypothetical protein